MKHIVGVNMWNRQDMVAYLLQGITASYPAGTHVVFHFDDCADASEAAYDSMRGYWLDSRGYPSHKISSQPEAHQSGGETKMMHLFMEQTDCDMLSLFQDDQRLNQPVCERLEWLCANGNPGVIGGRDGYEWGYRSFIGSPWSESVLAEDRRPAYGTITDRNHVNPSPLFYTRKLIETIGYYDSNFEDFYYWDDFCIRALAAGFHNYHLSTNLTHSKFGRCLPTHVGGDGAMSARDMAYVRKKHSLP